MFICMLNYDTVKTSISGVFPIILTIHILELEIKIENKVMSKK